MVLNSVRDLVTLPFCLAHPLQNTIKSLNQVALSCKFRRRTTEQNFVNWHNKKRYEVNETRYALQNKV